MRRAAAALLPAAALAGCAALAAGPRLEVLEVARSPYCNTPGEKPSARLLPDAAAVAELQAARGIVLVDAAALAPAPYALVEMGLRSTGGYAVTVDPAASVRDGIVALRVTFTRPGPGSLRTQALSSPCALVRLPPGDYAAVEARDAGGALLARGDAGPAR